MTAVVKKLFQILFWRRDGDEQEEDVVEVRAYSREQALFLGGIRRDDLIGMEQVGKCVSDEVCSGCGIPRERRRGC